MRLAIMQPYFLPYIGYFILAASVDKFVIYDDVNFIKGGWINRNRILGDGPDGASYITIPLLNASPFRRISEIEVVPPAKWRRKLLEQIRHTYSKAPFFYEAFPVVEEAATGEFNLISELSTHALHTVCRHLDISPAIVKTSSQYANAHLSGQGRVLDICKIEKCQTYVNLPGGRGLYNESDFQSEEIRLKFITAPTLEYHQRRGPFVANLSIVDVLMNVGMEKTTEFIRAACR